MSRPGIVFIASHLGYPMDRTPLGGGAMVGLHLARRWAADPALRLAALGSGAEPPFDNTETARYVRVAAEPKGLVDLSELAYAKFCRRFERETTSWLLGRRQEWRPEDTVVVVNDISEGPDLAALEANGYPIVSIWHVDVVDYFNKLYLRGLVAPSKVTKAYEALRRAKFSAAVPDVLKLVFEKQRETVQHSDLMVLPSRAMAETIERCYGSIRGIPPVGPRCLVQPWGAVGEWKAPDPAKVSELKKRYGLTPETDVIMTLSRISPEKGVHLLLEAVKKLEPRLKRDLVVIVCGEAAFMMGQAYMRKVRAAAAKLSGRARAVFPGYVGSADKPAMFALADLFVSPSVHESYGLNVVEALRAGLPVLASDHYGVKDILKAEYGVRVPYESLGKAPAQLARELETLINDKPRLKKMGIAAADAAAGMTFERAAANLRIASFGLLPKLAQL